MKFALETVGKCSGRLGSLMVTERLPNLKLPTPGLVLHTKGGCVPHLSKEVLQTVTDESQLLQLSLTNTLHMEEAIRASGTTIASFCAQPSSGSLVILKDPAETCQPGFHEKGMMPIFTRQGRSNVTVESFIAAMEAFRPDVYVPLFDGDTDQRSSKKRELKSLERTESFFSQCLELHGKSDALRMATVLGPVVGGYNLTYREKSIQFLSQFEADIGGYLIEGLHANGADTLTSDNGRMLEIIRKVCSKLPTEKVRLCFGAFGPGLVLEMVAAGVDVFDTSYAYLQAQEQRALVFSFDTADEGEDMALDMTNAQWAEDFSPLLKGCKCLTCTKHTRAYLHHLHNTREMLGPILLMIHNLHHYLQFFNAVRRHVASDSLPTLQAHLASQREPAPRKQTDAIDSTANPDEEIRITKKVKS